MYPTELAIRSLDPSHHALQHVLSRTGSCPVVRADLRAERKDEPAERKAPHLSDVVMLGQPVVIAAAAGNKAKSKKGHCSGSDRPSARSTIHNDQTES
jgi:hypothetical protein